MESTPVPTVSSVEIATTTGASPHRNIARQPYLATTVKFSAAARKKPK
jgi:hypothetical protein